LNVLNEIKINHLFGYINTLFNALGEPVSLQLSHVDFAATATSVDAQGYVVNNTIELLEFDYGKLYSHERPCLLDIHIDGDEVSPMGVRIKTLNR